MQSKIWSLFVAADKPVSVKLPHNCEVEVHSVALSNKIVEALGRSTLRMDYKDHEDTEGTEDNRIAMLCTLVPGRIEQSTLNIILTAGSDCVFSVIGKNDVYLVGRHRYLNAGVDLSQNSRTPRNPSMPGGMASSPPDVLPEQDVFGSVVPQPSKQKVIQYQEREKGTGVAAELGDHLRVSYKARVGSPNGHIFADANNERVTVGAEHKVPGLGAGLRGMCQGGMRRIFVPANSGFGLDKLSALPSNTSAVIDCVVHAVERVGNASSKSSSSRGFSLID